MPTWIRFFPKAPLDPAIGQGARTIPGVRWTDYPRYAPHGHFTLPDHAAPFLAAGLNKAGVEFLWLKVPSTALLGGSTLSEGWAWAVPRLTPQVRPGVLDMLRPYQKEALAGASIRDGVLLDHATAAGKALTLILATLLRPGPIVFTTLASNVDQLADEVRRFTYLTPYTIGAEEDGETRDARRERLVAQIERAKDDEARIAERIVVTEARRAKAADAAERARKDTAREKRLADAARHAARLAKLRAHAEDAAAHREGLVSDTEETVDNAETLADYAARCRAAGSRTFVVVAHEALPRWADAILVETGVTSLAIDEVHALKSHKRCVYVPTESGRPRAVPLTNRASAVSKLSKAASYRFAGTATLAEDSTPDLWSPFDLVEPEAFGQTPTVFRKRHCGATPTGYEGALVDGPETTRPEELRARMAYFVHTVTKQMVLPYLPKNDRIVTWLGAQALGPAPDDYGAELARASKAGKTAEREVHFRALAHMKDPAAILRILTRLTRGQKVIVFCGRRAHVESLHHKLRAALDLAGLGAVEGWAVHGETPPKKRELVRQAFQEHAGPCFLLGTGDAWGTGLNIQRAHYLLILHLDWMPGRIEQKEGRIHRPGGFDSETEYLFIENSEEAVIAARVFDKVRSVRLIGMNNLGDFREQLLGIGNMDAVLDRLTSWISAHTDLSEVTDTADDD